MLNYQRVVVNCGSKLAYHWGSTLYCSVDVGSFGDRVELLLEPNSCRSTVINVNPGLIHP